MMNDLQWTTSDAPFRLLEGGYEVLEAAPTLSPTTAPTPAVEFVTSTDAEIIRETFRVYGSLYLFFFFFFCFARKYLPRFYNIRSWVPEMECELAKTQEYGFISWCWEVFKVTDDQLLENCGMDALCYLRCLRLGAKLSFFGSMNAVWLIPLYLSAKDSEETAYLSDIFVKMSIANLPFLSKRFAGAIIAMYIIILYAMHLITKEYVWYIEYRHKFLSQRVARNYACYVSGIPPEYRSSQALAEYFRQCSFNTSVLEAHIAIDTPSLDAKVARRDKVVRKLEHALAMERKKGKKQTHVTFDIRDGVEAVKKVDSVDAFRSELSDLNKSIALEIGEIRNASHPLRKHLAKTVGSSDLSQNAEQDLGDYDRPVEGRGVSTRTLSTVGTIQERSTDTPSSVRQPLHLEDRVVPFNDIQGNQADERRTVFRTMPTKVSNLSGLISTQGSSAGNLGTITELAEIGSGHLEESPKAVISGSSSSDSDSDSASESEPQQTLQDEIPMHPFLSMFGLDSSVFAHSFEDVRRRLVRSASDSELTTSFGKPLDDESSTSSYHEDHPTVTFDLHESELHEYETPNVTPINRLCEADETRSTGDIEVKSRRFSRFARQNTGESFISRLSGGSSSRFPDSVRSGVRKVSSGAGVVGYKVMGVMKDVNNHAVSSSIKKAGNVGAMGIKTAGSLGVASVKKAAQTIQYAPDIGASLAAAATVSAAAVVPALLQQSDGAPKEAGFIVFNDLYSTQAARQMLHHPSANKMSVEPAGSPEEIFWRNVGLPEKAKRTGTLLSLAATTFLCFFWSIPVAFLSSLTEINSLKQKLPLLARWMEAAPWIEPVLALLAPLLLLVLNECILPSILKWFAAWEGHVSAPVLEASLFEKLAAFTIIQTFFVSTVSGTISAELSNILDDPEMIVALLANSLPAQSSYFIQVCFVFTFLLQGFDLIRAYPLVVAFLRNFFFGPRLTAKERRRTWKVFNSLEDPPEFWHAEILAQVMLFFVVYFVYSVIAPMTCIFLSGCFVICESGYRYHFIHNNHTKPDSGGKLWQGFIHVLMASMLIGELTMVGLLVLKQTTHAVPAMAPLIGITIVFMIVVIPKRNRVAKNLPTMVCVDLDRKNLEEGLGNARFVSKMYLQPSLKAQPVYPDEDDED